MYAGLRKAVKGRYRDETVGADVMKDELVSNGDICGQERFPSDHVGAVAGWPSERERCLVGVGGSYASDAIARRSLIRHRLEETPIDAGIKKEPRALPALNPGDHIGNQGRGGRDDATAGLENNLRPIR